MVETEQDGFKRLVCPDNTCGHIHYENPTPVVAAIVEYFSDPGAEYGEVILARGVGWPRGAFGLITGFLERGETVEQGCIREVKEELGLDGKIDKMVGVYDFVEQNQLIIAFHVTVKNGGEITLQPDELEEYRKVPLHKLKPWRRGTGKAVADFLSYRLLPMAAKL
eukprot:CAMPEP_0175121556 /NCGR_PEP_ID=MMETSP0087-20121206/1227_1 /TAXON_ID=136419 /ORGANISM="Unknown Unknown, Strain D1" /LENGTH=165 /DNA_ID=CAMNT_0016403097 /DNA_START=53 /DNA_END=550 /DNA_ORIENTATION=-